jgi:hypothetical protein
MKSEPSMGQQRRDVRTPVKSEGWFATFTLLDVGGAIGSSQLRRLCTMFAKAWQVTVRSVSDRSKSRAIGV